MWQVILGLGTALAVLILIIHWKSKKDEQRAKEELSAEREQTHRIVTSIDDDQRREELRQKYLREDEQE